MFVAPGSVFVCVMPVREQGSEQAGGVTVTFPALQD